MHFSFTDFLLIEDNEQGALQKEPVIVPFVDWFEITSLRNSY